MSFRHRRSAALVALVTVLGLPAQPARAGDPRGVSPQQSLVGLGQVGDHFAVVERWPDGVRHVLLDPAAGSSAQYVGTSQDGSRLAVVVRDAMRQRTLQLTGTAGGARQTVSPVNAGAQLYLPEVSPDGSRTVVTEVSAGSASTYDRVEVTDNGALRALADVGDVRNVGWLDADRLLTVDGSGGSYILPADGSAATPVTGFPTTTTAMWTRGSQVVVETDAHTGPTSLAFSAGTLVDHALTDLHPLLDASALGTATFSYDGATVYLGTNDGLYRVPFDGSAAAVKDDADAPLFVHTGPVDTLAPTTVHLGGATLTGTTVTLRATPVASDLAGYLLTRTSGSTTEKDAVYVAARPDGTVTDIGLTVGRTYGYDLAPVDHWGNVGPRSSVRQLTATRAPVPAGPSLASTSRTTAPFTVVLATGNATSTLYDVSYRRNAGATTTWITGSPGPSRTFGSTGGTGVTATTSSPGATYAFVARARDRYGNTTPVGRGTSTLVPSNESAATFTGTGLPKAVVRSGAWLGTTRSLTRVGQRASISTTGGGLGVLVGLGPHGGSFVVYRDGTKVRTVSTYAATARPRSSLTVAAAAGRHSWQLRWTASGTAGRSDVQLDGFGARQPS